MALYREGNGVVAIATGGEASFGAGDVMTHLIYAESAAVSKNPVVFDNSVLATGHEHGTKLTALKDETRLIIRGPLDDKSAPILLAFALGTDTKDATVDTSSGAVKHTIGIADCNTELSTTAAQVTIGTGLDDTTRAVTFGGVFVDTLRLFASDSTGMWEYEANCITAGYNTGVAAIDVSAKTKPTIYPFTAGKTFVSVMTTAATTAPVFDPPIAAFAAADPGTSWGSGITQWGPSVESVSILINNNGRTSYMGGAGAAAARVNRTKREVTITLGHKWDDGLASNQNLIGNVAAVNYAMMIYNRQNTLAGTTWYHSFAHYFCNVSPMAVTAPEGSPRTNESTWQLRDPDTTGIAPYYAFWVNTDDLDYI